MSHEIYTTKGFIISSEPKGESDKTFFIFTEDLGLIRASAQGVRKIESKLRYALQDFTFGEFSYVMTKTGPRLVHAFMIDPPHKVTAHPVKVKALRLIKRLCGQDESEPVLFHEMLHAFQYIDEHQSIGEEKSIEALLVLKILSVLGYWGEEKDHMFAESPFSQEILDRVAGQHKDIISKLNASLRATGLL